MKDLPSPALLGGHQAQVLVPDPHLLPRRMPSSLTHPDTEPDQDLARKALVQTPQAKVRKWI